MKRTLSLPAALLSAAFAIAVPPTLSAATPAVPAPKPGAMPMTRFYPDAVTEHSIVLDGKRIQYTARAGTIVLRNEQHQPTLRMFYVAYTENGASPERRPITFLYNGGPGSSSMWLHMGSWGPVRVEVGDGTITGGPPFRIVKNQYSLLNVTDLVFIDMPDSGFGRIVGVGKPKMFFGVDKDVAAFGQFVERYASTFGRWNSPKFLYGESYGTTRSAALVHYLQQKGVGINGVVLQSSILNFGLDVTGATPIGGSDWAYAFYLPTEAATAWYHHALPNRPVHLRPFVAKVSAFALGEYMNALARGSSLSQRRRNLIVGKLHAYTGLPESFIRNNNLRVPYWRFESELLRDNGLETGRLDGRFVTDTTDGAENQPRWDPTDAAIDYPYTTAINQYLRVDLKYNPTLQYRTQIYNIIAHDGIPGGGWDNTHRGNPTTDVTPDLADALSYDPHLKIFSANGYYDFATPFLETEFALDHLNVRPSLLQNITYGFYKSGHMIYLAPKALAHYHADLERWYAATLGNR
ncbi:MAG: peptidase S10 [Candidatus Eremiobacteraeota bacterium]|uniref:Carboxypeptidase C n=1 Tax=mine drainage metagenome TaxID=410659 RepID=E6PEF6_9ZZZZ|nr:peptidase S10 [Candidatus Eremiobacteraeota bacterium]